MNSLSIILMYGVSASLILSVFIFAVLRINPRLMLRSYPKDIKAAVPPATGREKRQMLFWRLPFLLLLLGFPLAAALTAHLAKFDFLETFLSAFGVFFLFNLVDWLILDWLILCTFTPKFVILPGTEGMAGYKNYWMPFRGFLIGTVLAIGVGLIFAAILSAL